MPLYQNGDEAGCTLVDGKVKTPFSYKEAYEQYVIGVQVFGGHGYIREHGMEQIVRDTRIATLYEGTTGIQALDLLGRKVLLMTRGGAVRKDREMVSCAGHGGILLRAPATPGPGPCKQYTQPQPESDADTGRGTGVYYLNQVRPARGILKYSPWE